MNDCEAGAPVVFTVGNPLEEGGGVDVVVVTGTVVVVVGGMVVVVVVIGAVVVVDGTGEYVHVHVPDVTVEGATVGTDGQSTVPVALHADKPTTHNRNPKATANRLSLIIHPLRLG